MPSLYPWQWARSGGPVSVALGPAVPLGLAVTVLPALRSAWARLALQGRPCLEGDRVRAYAVPDRRLQLVSNQGESSFPNTGGNWAVGAFCKPRVGLKCSASLKDFRRSSDAVKNMLWGWMTLGLSPQVRCPTCMAPGWV